MDKRFFEKRSEPSRVKAHIVVKYFTAWARVMVGDLKKRGLDETIKYVDLFSGPGLYEDGSASTPILILQTAIANSDLSKRLVTIFNDKDESSIESLREAISQLPDVHRLAHTPQILAREVDDSLLGKLEKMDLCRTLFFLDPWGYKGVSLRLLKSSLKDWGSECIFFFNYNRVNMGLSNSYFDDHMEDYFGAERVRRLRSELPKMSPDEREAKVLAELTEALRELGGRFVLHFGFKKGERRSHFLIFVTKNPLGHDIMSGVMSKYSSSQGEGVPDFEYARRDIQQLSFEFGDSPLEALAKLLLADFAGRTMTMAKVYAESEAKRVGKHYAKTNYKDALKRLEKQGKITASPPAAQRPTDTFADDVIAEFPKTRA